MLSLHLESLPINTQHRHQFAPRDRVMAVSI